MQSNPQTLSALAHVLRSARAVAVLTGAGISAESGVPTFRDAQTGLWARFDPHELATPAAFARNPKLVWDWYAWRRARAAEAQPNPGHRALVAMEARVPRFTLVTQNVDGLHARAGSRNLVELHGNIARVKCSREHTLVAGSIIPSAWHENARSIFGSDSVKYPTMISGSQVKVKVCKNAEILASVTLPYSHSRENILFSSAISNPPGIETNFPAVVLNRFGSGKVLYVAGELEKMEHDPHRKAFVNLIRMLINKPMVFEVDAPKPVEVTLFNQLNNKRFIINVLNYQNELPNIPVETIGIRLSLEGKKPVRLLCLPDEKEIDYTIENGWLKFNTPQLDTFLMFALDYQ
jgi:hypothetical protein